MPGRSRAGAGAGKGSDEPEAAQGRLRMLQTGTLQPAAQRELQAKCPGPGDSPA